MNKSFKVVSVSKNTNAFGLNGVVLLAADGEAFEAATNCTGPFSLPVGEVVNIPVSCPDASGAARYLWVSTAGRTFEIPRELPKPSVEVMREVFPSATPEIRNRYNLDNQQNWGKTVSVAINMGLCHAKTNTKPSTEAELVKLLNLRMNVTLVGRYFQFRALRTAYGAAYTGIARMREVRARNGT